MLVYQGWFEAQMVLHPEAKTLNLSRRGLRITGMEPVTSETLLSYPDRRSEIDSIISNLPSGCGQRAGTEHFASSIEELMEELDRLENICLEGRAVLAGANPSDGSGMERVLGSLDAVDERIRSLKHRDVAGFLLASVLRDLGTSPKDGSAALENSGKVYEALADSASYHRRLLRDALQKIQDFTPHADVSNGE